jgi:hypothetical protein
MFSLIPSTAQLPLPVGMKNLDASYPDGSDRTKHKNVIARLADELNRPEAEITTLYEGILTDLRPQARIPDYLPILVSKRVKRILKN